MMASRQKTGKKKKEEVYSAAVTEYLTAQHRKLKTSCEHPSPSSGENSDACHYLGLFHETVVGATPPPQHKLSTAGRYFERSCRQHKYGASCVKLGEYYQDGLGDFPQDANQAASAFEQGCLLGEGEGCYRYGTLLMAGKPERGRVAEKKFVQGCALEHQESCEMLGWMYRKGLGGPQKKMVFLKNYTSLGELLPSPGGISDGGERDQNVTLALLLKNSEKLAALCKQVLGVPASPMQQHHDILPATTTPLAVPKIPAEGGMDLSFGCLSGKILNGEICHTMANWMSFRNPDLAGLMYEQNCSNNESGESCLRLGEIFLRGTVKDFSVGGKHSEDHERAADAFEKACLLGQSEGCHRAGVLRSSTLISKTAPVFGKDSYSPSQARKCDPTAIRLLTKGCALNDEKSCVHLSSLYRKLRGESPLCCWEGDSNDNRWRRYAHIRWRSLKAEEKKKACRRGQFEACARLSELCKKTLEK